MAYCSMLEGGSERAREGGEGGGARGGLAHI